MFGDEECLSGGWGGGEGRLSEATIKLTMSYVNMIKNTTSRNNKIIE